MRKIWVALWRWLYDPAVNDELARVDRAMEARERCQDFYR